MMDSVKFLHCADLHLDAPLTGLPDHLVQLRQEELRENFGRIVDLARKENVQIIMISGDLFDRESVKKTTIDYIIKKIEEIKWIPVLICTGNHDSLLRNYYYQMSNLPENLYLFDRTISRIDFPDKNLCIYGISFYEPLQEKNLLKGFVVDNENKINIMMMHGEVVTSGGKSIYNPITLSDIEKSKLDYIALGHVHSFSGLNKAGKVYWCYPGTPEGNGFDESGVKGVVIGSISKGYTHIEFRPTGKREYIVKEVDISGACTYEEITKKIKDNFEEKSENNFYKIILKGDIPEDFGISSEVIRSKLEEDTYFLKVINETTYDIDINKILVDDTLKNVFINNIIYNIKDSSREEEIKLLKRSLKIGICALNGERIEFDENF